MRRGAIINKREEEINYSKEFYLFIAKHEGEWTDKDFDRLNFYLENGVDVNYLADYKGESQGALSGYNVLSRLNLDGNLKKENIPVVNFLIKKGCSLPTHLCTTNKICNEILADFLKRGSILDYKSFLDLEDFLKIDEYRSLAIESVKKSLKMEAAKYKSSDDVAEYIKTVNNKVKTLSEHIENVLNKDKNIETINETIDSLGASK